MKITLIIIGDEILLGQVNDLNTAEIAHALAPAGWNIGRVVTIGDDAKTIVSVISEALSDSDLVITTGGLGPTKDDITKNAVASLFDCSLVENADVLENIRKICDRRHIKLNELTAAQALVPNKCTVIQNTEGTAPIMWFERDGRVLVCLPGVPFEASAAIRGNVRERLLNHFKVPALSVHRKLLVDDITESDLAANLEPFENQLPAGFHLAYLPMQGYIRLRLDGVGSDLSDLNKEADRQLEKLVKAVGKHLCAIGFNTPQEAMIDALRAASLTIAVAESCTGGAISHKITAIAGCSDIYMGGVTSYSLKSKTAILGVSQESLNTYGAVSLPVVQQMAEGAARLFGADCTIATSGIAGPGGATESKPVGTVCVAVKSPAGVIVDHLLLPGDRARVIERAANYCIIKLVKRLNRLRNEADF